MIQVHDMDDAFDAIRDLIADIEIDRDTFKEQAENLASQLKEADELVVELERSILELT